MSSVTATWNTFQVMSNFRFIERNVDVKNIVQQVLDNPDDWGVAGTIKGAAGDLQPYGSVSYTHLTLPTNREV